jgi:transcriptional regulator with XRE-family HTH domain
MNPFAERLGNLMKRAGVGQDQLADEIGLSQGTISRYVRGDTEPRLSDLQKLATFFRVTIEELIGPPDGVLEFRDHEPEIEYQVVTTAEEALGKLARRNKTLHEALRQQIVAVERWDAQNRKRKSKR